LIAGTHKLFRDGLKCLVKRHFGEKVEIDETDVDDCKSVCNDLAPDVLLLDVDIKQGVGLELASQLAGSSARPKVIVITGKSDPILLNLLMETNAVGFLTKGNSVNGLVNAIDAVMNGSVHVNEKYSQLIVQGKVEGSAFSPLNQLSLREMEVMLSLAEGRSPEEIANHLFISPKTVASYKQRIHDKLHTRNTADITRVALESGLLSSP